MEDLLCTEETRCHPLSSEADPLVVFQCMLKREAQYDPCDAAYLVTTQRHGMDALWRRKICHWMFATGDAFELTKDTVACAIAFMDRYLSLRSVDKVMLQLVSMISMLIASKMHEHQPISMEEMDLLSHSKFTREEIRQTEAEMVQVLTWQLNPPTSFTFARDFIKCLDGIRPETRKSLEQDVTDLLQDATQDYISLRFLNSTLAIEAVQIVYNAKNLAHSSILYDAMHAVGSHTTFVDCVGWFRALYEAKHGRQARFVSVEMEECIVKTAETLRSISPTSVDRAAEFLRCQVCEEEDEGYDEDEEEDVDLIMAELESQRKVRPLASSPELQRPVPSKRSRLHYEQ